MVRAITRPVQKDRQALLLPGGTEAEPWEVWTTGANSKCLRVCQKPADAADRRGTLALPVSQVIALPLWLQATDAKQFRSMISLQLESRGLQPRAREAVFDWSVVTREESRTLVLVGVLPAILPEELETAAFSVFETSARCFPFPDNSLVLWKEQDRLAVAVTRGSELAYFHLLADEYLTTRSMQDLTCILASLQVQDVIESVRQAVLWHDPTPKEIDELRALLGVPVSRDARPTPGPPPVTWNLTPASVGEVRRHRVTRRWWVRAGLVAALLILASAGALMVRLLLAQRDISDLKQWQGAHAASLKMIHDTTAAWRDLQPVVGTNSYPLETLLHVSEALPADQVRITLFEVEGDHLLIKAEAKNLTAAFQLFDALKKNPHLTGYTWEMAQPHSLANDVTQLQIEGTHAIDDAL